MPRRGRLPTDADIEDEIRRQALKGQPPNEITRTLELDPRFADRAPSLRTVQRYVKKFTAKDTSEPWTWAEADGEEAALVLPVLGAVMERTEGRVTHFTKEQAKWVAKVRGAAPDLDAWYAWGVAMAYRVAAEEGGEADRASLDALLAFAPWRSLEATERFLQWAGRHRAHWFSLPRFILVPAGRPFDANKDVKPRGNVAGLFIATEIELDLVGALNVPGVARGGVRIGSAEPPDKVEGAMKGLLKP